eukprot:15109465-Alexandrium_andersonii.AAC.1
MRVGALDCPTQSKGQTLALPHLAARAPCVNTRPTRSAAAMRPLRQIRRPSVGARIEGSAPP